VSEATDATIDEHAAVSYEEFVEGQAAGLRRALIARYGVEIGTEVAAEALAYAWENWTRVGSMASTVGYLYRVGQSKARRHHRWRRSIDLPPETRPPDDTTTRLEDALLRLKPNQRVAVVLVHCHRYSYEEAAEMLGIPLSTLRNHLHRGIAKLRKTLEVER
jgi:RNA polymerase sigma factor (sigma-70 family)